ncbi:MAG: hypothetical protein KKD46_07375, partial [Euryarchaeota archaeon]|nr:hypothetical protein [Euryarchaeota archaeon]
MVNKNVVRGIGFVLMISLLLYSVNALTVDSTNPSVVDVTNIVGETRTFNLTVNESSNFSWYINGSGISSGITGTNEVLTSSYLNSTLSVGYWNITAVAVSVANGTVNGSTWWWTVNPASGGETAPTVTSAPDVSGITGSGANISFSLDQSNALTNIYLGTTPTPDATWFWHDGDNATSPNRKIILSGLNEGTLYYYTVYAYNSSNQSLFNNSPINSFTTIISTAPAFTINPTNDTPTDTSVNIQFSLNQSNALTNIYLGTNPTPDGTWFWRPGDNSSSSNRNITLSGLTENTLYYYTVYAYNSSNQTLFTNSTINNFKTRFPFPKIISSSVSSPPAPLPSSTTLESTEKQSVNFTATFDQPVTITWSKNGGSISGTGNNISSYYLESSPSPGTWNITVNGTNVNGSVSKTWNWTVRSKTYETGNRVWDANKGMSTTYKWSPMSFYAFYYDVNDDVGNEILEINLNSKTDRSVRAEKLIYTTKPENVNFSYKAWGSYDVIGFMADKYFAAYTLATNSSITLGTPRSTINYMQLHKILMDDKVSHTVRASSTYPLADGYAVTLKELGSGRQAWISILKDGGEVYSEVKGVGDTIVYTRKVGSVNELPLIALHIGSVFEGATESMVQIDGIFQISESYTSVNSGNNYGIMSIVTASNDGITMSNKNAFTLASASTIDIMGDMKFIVAKSDTLRFAPMVKRSYEYEVRGTISNNETNNEWTPLNFEGFYYNLDEDVGTEKMTMNLTSGRTVGKENIIYTTEAKSVQTKSNLLDSYKVIGFMAEKYFAGYLKGKIAEDINISTIERNQLHKVLIDDDTQRMIYAGSTLTLNEGYVIKIKDVNMGAGTPSVWLTVYKDGVEIPGADLTREKGQVFKYEKDVGTVKGLPLFALKISDIFRGKEATFATIKGTFQISESYTTVKSGDTFDKMKVEGVASNIITMKNPNTVSLDPGSSDTLMKNIKLKVADTSSVIRFYPYIMVNGSALAANQLAISVPSSMMVKDTITISVTSGTGTAQDNAEVSFNGEVIGTTDSTGKLNYTLTKAGLHNFSATKLGYEKAIKAVQIAEYVDNRLSLVLPEFIDQFIPVQIKVIVSGTGNAISGANITLDGTGIGTTDSSGVLTYTFTNSGIHNLAASRSGYISVQREIEVRMPFVEFTALDINFRPDVVARGQNVYVWSNITNSGTKEGTLPVALIINETVVENKNVTLAPGNYGEVNFSYKIELPAGNYTVEILGQQTTMPVKDEPLNIFLVVGAITGLGALTVYFLTSKNLMSVEAIKSKMNMETVNQVVAKARSDLESLSSKFLKGGGKGGSP